MTILRKKTNETESSKSSKDAAKTFTTKSSKSTVYLVAFVVACFVGMFIYYQLTKKMSPVDDKPLSQVPPTISALVNAGKKSQAFKKSKEITKVESFSRQENNEFNKIEKSLFSLQADKKTMAMIKGNTQGIAKGVSEVQKLIKFNKDQSSRIDALELKVKQLEKLAIESFVGNYDFVEDPKIDANGNITKTETPIKATAEAVKVVTQQPKKTVKPTLKKRIVSKAKVKPKPRRKTKKRSRYKFISSNGESAVLRDSKGNRYRVKKGQRFNGAKVISITGNGIKTTRGWIK